jgi:hypothetical protein
MARVLRHVLRVFALLSLVLCLVSVALLAPGVAPKSFSTRWFIAGVEHGTLVIGWWPAAPYRPAWAGQVSRLDLRYTRWSDGSAEIDLPLWLPAGLFMAMTVLAALFAARAGRRRLNDLSHPRGFDLLAAPIPVPATSPQRPLTAAADAEP